MRFTIIFAVICAVFLPNLIFSQSVEDSSKIVLPKTEEQVVLMPDQPAVFPGGDEALQTFIKRNINYPEKAIMNNESGKVLIEFEVEKDGSITNIRVKKSVSPNLDQESLRMIRSMPKWEAAKHDGISVRSSVVVPVIFKLG